MTTIDMSKDFAEARARGEAANEIDDLVQRLFVDTIGCCADLDADDQCERCRLRRDAARVLSRMQVALTSATERAERAERQYAACAEAIGVQYEPFSGPTAPGPVEEVVAHITAARRSEMEHIHCEAAIAALTAARALLREVVEVWSRCVARDFQAPEDAEVRALGERIGFGALMDAAEKEWRASLVADYPPCVGGEFVHGPCRATVDDLRARIEAHLEGR